MKYAHMLFASMFLLSLSACSTTPLFKANFDSDPLGGLPATSPPGDPVGDSIWLGTEGYPPHAVTVISDDAFSGHSLKYSNIDISSLLTEVRFYSKELTSSGPRYWATWVGRLENVSDATPPLQIHFGNFTIGYATFRLHAGKLWVRRTPERGSDYEVVGDVLPGRLHNVIVTIDDAAGTFSLSLFQYRGPTLEVGPRPLGSRSVLRERRLDIQLRFNVGGHSSAAYLIDDITILQEEPETP